MKIPTEEKPAPRTAADVDAAYHRGLEEGRRQGANELAGLTRVVAERLVDLAADFHRLSVALSGRLRDQEEAIEEVRDLVRMLAEGGPE